jgi:hypothetical protein
VTSVDHLVDFDVDHRVVPARVEVPDDAAGRELELVVPPPPSWSAPPPALPRLDER